MKNLSFVELTAIPKWQFLLSLFLSQHHCAEGPRTLAPGSESAIKITPTGEGAISEIHQRLTCIWAPERVRWLLGNPLALRIVSMLSARMPYFLGGGPLGENEAGTND